MNTQLAINHVWKPYSTSEAAVAWPFSAEVPQLHDEAARFRAKYRLDLAVPVSVVP